MTAHAKASHGTIAWFDMVGTLMVEAARRADLPGNLNVSLVERYTDGALLSDGLIQGIRFDIVSGKPSYRVGAGPHEQADIIIEVSATVARELNALHSTDPNYRKIHEHFLATGEMRVSGDVTRLGDWMATVHDPIVERTC